MDVQPNDNLKTSFVKRSGSTLLFWICVALAALLLAPYAGIHIITTPPLPTESVDTTSATIAHEADTQDEMEPPEEPLTPSNPSESLQEIEGLLAE